jgi:GNAT superfamily N-acetyltransferase
MSTDAIVIRKLPLDELGLIRDLDRTEQIDALYVQCGTRLELREGDWSAPPWDTTGEGEHSVAGQQATLEQFVRDGAIVLGAFDDGQLVGVGVVVVHIRPETAQLAYLYVTRRERARGVGRRLSDALENIAREAGDTSVVVSATPSLNTVRFYQRLGYEAMAEPLPELLELEPQDVHMQKRL